MNFKERLLLLLMIQALGLFCQNSIRKCSKEVSNCPITEELWYKRYEEFPCFKEGLNYTCMMAVGGVLVEACINEYDIRAFTGSRCPFIHSCDGIEPVLAIEGNWPLCPEDMFGCPPADHPVYTVYHMYKYPACIVRNVTELLTTKTTTLEFLTSPTTYAAVANVTTTNTTNGQVTYNDMPGIVAGVIIGAVFVLLSIVAVCIWKISQIRRGKRKRVDDQLELCNITPDTNGASDPLLPTSDETYLKNPSTPSDSDTEEKTMHMPPDQEETFFKRPSTRPDSDTKEKTMHMPPDPGNRRGRDEETQLFLQPTGNRLGPDEETQFFLQPRGNRLGRDEETQFFLQPTGHFHHLKNKLVTLSKTMTEKVTLSPVQIYANIPVELLYAKVVIQTNARYAQLGRQYFQDSDLEMEQKTVEKPDDIFYKNKEQTKRIFMVGNAAHGKTMYCLWLLQHWYHAQSEPKGTKTHDEWRKAVGSFDFVFLIQLRAVKKSSATIIDMICKDILKIVDIEYIGWLTKALKSGKYRCLILIDGLDEWKPDKNVTEDVRFNGMPITDDIENCVIFFTMRPWKFEEISRDVSSEDLVIEILGLDENGIQEVTKNVLFSQYRLNVKKPEDKLKYHTIMKKLEDKTLASIMNIPLLAVLCVKIWFKGEEIGNSLTGFYTAMVNMLVERAKGPHETDRNHDYSQEMSSSCFIDKNLLLKLGKLAYDGLMTSLYIFEKPAETILKDLDLTKSQYDFTLNVGLLSREEVDSSMPKKVKIYFFHASLQEYFSAVYIVENEEIRNSFFQHLSSVKTILEFGNVLAFLSGLDATLGSDISKHIVNIAKEDKGVSEYRTSVNPFGNLKTMVESIYKLQVSCYRELKYTQLCTDLSKQAVPYHVSDVYVDSNSDIETIRTTVDILTYHHADIRSLFMFKVDRDIENGVPDSILTQYLDHTVSLQSLSICGGFSWTLHHISDIFFSLTSLLLDKITLTTEALSTLQTKLQSNTVIQAFYLGRIYCQDSVVEGRVLASLSGIIQILPHLPCLTTLNIGSINKEDKPVLLDALSRLSGLHNIIYRHSGTSPMDEEYYRSVDRSVVQTLRTFSGLRRLHLYNLKGCELQLKNDMLHLKTVDLLYVYMLPLCWKNFIESVLSINHQFDVSIFGADIDDESWTFIKSSPQLQITQNKSRYAFDFTRVWPPP